MDFELMDPLVYEEEDTVINRGKRHGSVEIEEITTRSPKRPRVSSPLKRSKTPLQQLQLPSIVDDDVIPDFEVEEDEDVTSTIEKNTRKRNDSATTVSSHERASTSSRSNVEVEVPDHVASPNENAGGEGGVVHVRYRRVLKRMPTGIPYLPVTCEDGSRLYLRIKSSESVEEEVEKLPRSIGGFITEWEKVRTEAKIIKDKFHKNLAKAVDDCILPPLPVERNQGNVTPGATDMGCLWVEKYKPRSFLDLLSPELVNKPLLHWIKLWDKSVFGVDYLAKVKATRQKFATLEMKDKERDEKFHRKTIACNEDYDDGGRPSVKVVLLTGDPGLGKTTCAHVIARQAGYNVREMNASDDRSTEIFGKVLDATTQSRSETFQGGKPNCLIIDEIDGAPLASVNILVEYMLGNATEKGKSKKKKILRRPVICICNDLYATSLKILRKHAFIIQFPAVSVNRLVERLGEVSCSEKLYLDQNTLQRLCQKSECDIRSCLSTLQFVQRKGLTSKDALLAHIGTKDKTKGIFSVWDDIFTIPLEKRYQDAHPDPSKPANRFRDVLQVVQNFGEYDKLWGGVNENYLNVKYRDSYLESILEGLEWSRWFEDIRDYIDRSQTYGMYGYLPMFFVMSHFLYARRDGMKLKYPSSELFSKLPKFQNAIRNQIIETPAATARFMDPYMLITDVFPAILTIIQPSTIRPVPSQIWTPKEREILKNVVEIMLTYDLCYTQTKNPETGAYTFVLEPDVEEMSKFKTEESTTSKKPFPYSLKQLIAREIDTEKLRRNDKGPEIVQKETFKVPEAPQASTSKVPDAASKSPVPIARDFFGRPIIPVADTSPEAESKRKRSVNVYFRYKEGYSNAVRRFVKMRDLE